MINVYGSRLIFIRYPSPFSALLIGVLFVAVIAFISPVEFLYYGTIYSWLYIIISILSLFLGLLIGNKEVFFKSKLASFSVKIKYARNIFFIIATLAVTGVVLRIYDKYFIRSAGFTKSMMENREAVIDAGINFFSIFSSMLYPLVLFVPFYYLLLRKMAIAKPTYLVVSVILSMFPIVDGLLFGSRSIIVIWLLLMILYLYTFELIKPKINFKNFSLFFVFAIFFFLFNGYIFDVRAKLIGLDPVESTQISVYAHFIPLNNSVQLWLESISGSIPYFLALGMINFMQYVSHGFFELLYVIDTFDVNNIYYGSQQFAIIIKFFCKILQIPFSFEANQEMLVRTGVYNTLFGPIYYDFGFWGIFFSFLIGFLIGKTSYMILIRKNLIILPIYLYMLLMLYFTLIVNLIVFAHGLYNFISFIIFFIIVFTVQIWKKLEYGVLC